MKSGPITLGVVLACALLARTAPARADDHVDAEQAFREGRRLLDAGQLEQACERLAASQKLESAAGTLLNLADCYERRGMIASAADAYKEAAVAAALRSRADWEQFALTRYGALRPRVPTLTIHVPPAARIAGLTVLRDGRQIPIGDQDVEERIDPGTHTLSATAPGRTAWSTKLVIAPSSTRSVDVPVLAVGADGAPSAAPSRERAPSEAAGSWRRPAGFVIGGAGLVGLGVGAVAGIVAINGHSDAKSKCPAYPGACTAEGTAANERATDFATVSTIGFIAGGALLGAGLALVLTAPSEPSSSSSSSSSSTAVPRLVVALPGRVELSGSF